MLVYVEMDKKKEDAENVWYVFRTDMAGERYINERGIPRLHLIEVQGIGIFNKTTKTFSVDWDQTNDYFKDESLMIVMIGRKIAKSCKEGSFPDLIVLATG